MPCSVHGSSVFRENEKNSFSRNRTAAHRIREDLQPAEADRNHPQKARSCLSAKAGVSTAGGAGFDNELIPIIVSLVEQRALVLVEIPVLLIQP